MESLLKVRSHCTSDPHEGSRQTRAFVVCSWLGVRSVPNMECLSCCPKVWVPGQNQDYLRSSRRGERAASIDSPAPFSPTHTSAFSLLFITFPTITKHLLHLLCQSRAATSAGSWSEDGHFPWLGGSIQVPCTSHCESASPDKRLSMPSPITPETFTSNTRLHCLPMLKISLLPLPFHIHKQFQAGGFIWQVTHSSDHKERTAKFWLFPASLALTGNVPCSPILWMWEI